MLNKVATYRLGTDGVLFNEIVETNSRPLVKKGLHQGGVSVNILELSALLQEDLTWAPLFWIEKIEDCVLQGCNFIKTLVHHIFFLKIFFLKQLVLGTYSKNSLWRVPFIAKLQSENYRLVTLLKELHHRIFSDKFSNFCNQLFFATFSFMKKQITWKITWKLGKEKLGKGRLFGLFTLSVS